ncbi:MAG TPA: response regulator [Acidimicrobiales bacterium]|nr:response regulator [Acidimicrobiales bacterium]
MTHALVVDDSRSMRSILGRILRGFGMDVEEAPDGRAALDRLVEGERPDVALVDWHMPNMTGVELVSEVRSRPELAGMTIVMVTSESEPDQIGLALAAGADEYIIKPFTPDAVADKLAMLGIGPGASGCNQTGEGTAP